MRRAQRAWAFAQAASVVSLACALAGGCAQQKRVTVDFSDSPRDYLGKDYERVYDRWTRHEQVFKDEDVALEVWATYKSWDFREAYIERYAEVYALAEADENTLREAQREIVQAAYEFHVTAQSTFYKWNDLDKPNSPWRATLIDALGHELAPEYVRIVKLPDAYERAFFPSKTPFTKTYAIRFAVPSDGSFTGAKSGSITLRITSPVGRVELHWTAAG
jgi:hypothetical protein